MPLGNQVNIRVDDALLEQLKTLARERYSTPSQVVREALALYLKRVAQENKP
jgi:predicted transcriptional regulator